MAVHYVDVDGLRLPAKLGGHPALEFCNTLAGWGEDGAKDYLKSYDHLAAWAGFVELVGPERVRSLRREARRSPNAAEAVVDQARALRARLYEVFRDGPLGAAFELLARDVHAAAVRLRLRGAGERVEWEIEPAAGLTTPLVGVGWSAGQLLTSAEAASVRTCPGAGCGWLFLDPSGRRRWCTMATCGNRAKVKRFAMRHRHDADAPEGGVPEGDVPEGDVPEGDARRRRG
jgi:predicted RNA-binding Zn ribbon-like protein